MNTLAFNTRTVVFRNLEALAANDPDSAVRQRASEILRLMRDTDRLALVQEAGQVALDTNAARANRLRALDIVYELMQ